MAATVDPRAKRILSLWFPRLAAERVLREDRGLSDAPLAIVDQVGNTRQLSSLCAQAQAEGLSRGQPLRDAMAMCPNLVTRTADTAAEAAFLAVLRRWAGKFSPWVASEPPAGLVVDLTGCAHLFGGEARVLDQIESDCADLRLTVRAGVGDTLGAAWALARYAGQGAQHQRSGDAIDQEARATRARAGKTRHWTRGGAAPVLPVPAHNRARIAPPGQMHAALAPLPIAALRLPGAAREGLSRLGLRRVEDLAGMPRAALARRFGADVLLRLDQALGRVSEPISPAAPAVGFATRLTLPDPIGLTSDIEAAFDRLLPPLGAKLKAHGQGARRLRLELMRVDQNRQIFDLGLARATHDPDRMRPLLGMKLDQIEPGFGIDIIRVEATQTEPTHAQPHRGPFVGDVAQAQSAGLDDLIGRLGARIGLEAITRRAPSDSHIPEKSAQILAAAWSDAAQNWPMPAAPRPMVLFAPEPVHVPPSLLPPDTFRWRGQTHSLCTATGPERVAPEWWLDDPAWRSGLRDYWRVTTTGGAHLWLYYAHGAALSEGWFCHGTFA